MFLSTNKQMTLTCLIKWAGLLDISFPWVRFPLALACLSICFLISYHSKTSKIFLLFFASYNIDTLHLNLNVFAKTKLIFWILYHGNTGILQDFGYAKGSEA